MAGRQKSDSPANSRKRIPAVDPEARQNQLIALAIDAAERKLLEPNPPNQLILHYLKLGTAQAELEKEKLRKENLLLDAKTSAIESQARTEELYRNAIEAMASYSGGFRQESEPD